MRIAAGLAGALVAALLAGCWSQDQDQDQRRAKCKDPKARQALDAARKLSDEDGLDGPLQPHMREAYRDLRQETASKCGEDDQADLSPDGNWIAFSSTDLSPAADIFLKRVGSPSQMQKSFHTSQDAFPRFSPDGKWIAFATDRNGNWDIYIMDATLNGAVRQVSNGSADDIAPTWSPDGKRMAYCSRNADGEWEIWIVNLDTSQLTRLGPGLYPRWSPKDERIAFQRPRNRCGTWYGVYIVDTTGNNVTELVAPPGWGAINPTWDPSGEWIAFASVNKSTAARAEMRIDRGDDIWIVRADGTMPTQVTCDDAAEWDPCWGRDGRIYFTATRDGHQNLWSITPLVPGTAAK